MKLTAIPLLACALPVLAGCMSSGSQAPAATRPPHGSAPARIPEPPTASISGKITLSTSLGSPDGMTWGAGSLWAGGYGGSAVAQIDPSTGRVIRVISVGTSPLGVAVIKGFVWAADYGSGQVSKIDPATGKVVATTQVGAAPTSAASIGGHVWVFDQASSAATVLSPVSGRVLRSVPLPVQPGFASAGAGRVWVPDLGGTSQTVIGLSRTTGKVAVTVHVGPYPSEVAFGFGSGWVTCKGSIYRFTPSTGAVTAVIRSPGAEFDGIAESAGSMWAGDIQAGLIDRISPARDAITARMAVGGSPRHIVPLGGRLWVALFDKGTVVAIRVR